MKVSIIVCSKNRHVTLRRSLEGMRRLSFPEGEYEIVVAEEAPAADPPEGTRYLYLGPDTGRGLCYAQNLAVKECSGDIVAFLNDDTTPAPQWLSEIVKPFEDPAVCGVAGMVRAQSANLIGEAEEILGFPGGGIALWVKHGDRIVPVNSFSTSNCAVRRSVFDRWSFPEGGTAAHVGGDAYFSFQVCGACKCVFTPFAVVYHEPRADPAKQFEVGYHRSVCGFIYKHRELRHSRLRAVLGRGHDSYLVRAIVGLAIAVGGGWIAALGLAIAYYGLSLWTQRHAYSKIRRKGSFLVYPFVKLVFEMGFALGEFDALRCSDQTLERKLVKSRRALT